MQALQYVLVFVLGSVVVGLIVGYYLGKSVRTLQKRVPGKREREATMKVLTALLAAADRLNMDMDTHNTEIKEVGRQLVDMRVDDGDLRSAQRTLLGEIASVLDANKQLEDDLNYARLRMEEQAQEIDRTRREARTDDLSGVGNRKAFEEKLQMVFGTWKRERRPFVLALCDVDHFKWINDTHGHRAGDRVVTNVGKFLKAGLRDRDFVARFGGDEFAIIYDNVDIEIGTVIAERLRVAVSKNNFGIRVSDEEAAVTFSIGVAAPTEDCTPESIIEQADKALYRAKEAGRNKVYCYVTEEDALVAIS